MLPTKWALRVGRYTASVRVSSELATWLQALLCDLCVRDVDEPTGCIEVVSNAPGLYTIRSDDRVWDDAVAEADVADQIVRMLLQASLDAEASLVHIHAGAVALGERTVIVAGFSASGKSTAIVALLGAGFAYVTDERLVLTAEGHGVEGSAKPISLISGSFATLAHLDPHLTGHGVSNGTTWQIPASSIGAVAAPGVRAPSVLVFLAYNPEVSVRVATLSCHEAAARLLGDSPDVITRGPTGAAAIVELATSVPAVELEYCDAGAMVTTVRGLLERPPVFTLGTPTRLEGRAAAGRRPPKSANAVGTAVRYAIVKGVTAWVIGDHAVAYVESTGEVVELDELGTTWLQLLDDVTIVDELIDEVTEATGFERAAVSTAARHAVHGLWTAGVVGPIDGSPRGR